MHSKKVTFANGRFCIILPSDWDEYEDEKNTYAFFNSQSKTWKGNLRITHLLRRECIDLDEDKAAIFIRSELAENEGAKKIKIGRFDCAHYKQNAIQDNQEFVLFFWILGKYNDLLMCSFTIAKSQENTEENRIELEIVENILKSLKIIHEG